MEKDERIATANLQLLAVFVHTLRDRINAIGREVDELRNRVDKIVSSLEGVIEP